MSQIVNKSINVVKPESVESGLLVLRMEAAAIRDQMVLNMNALIAKIDRALPEPEPERYRPKSQDDYRKMYGMPPKRRLMRGDAKDKNGR